MTVFRLWVKRDEREKAEADLKREASMASAAADAEALTAEASDAAGDAGDDAADEARASKSRRGLTRADLEEERAENAADGADETAMLEQVGLTGLSEESEDMLWDVHENYIFYVVVPFLVDFFGGDFPMLPSQLEPQGYGGGAADQPPSTPMSGGAAAAQAEAERATFERVFGGRSGDVLQVDDAHRESLVHAAKALCRTLRKMVRLEYVMGKELLRKALDQLLDAFFRKRLVTGENLIESDERRKVEKAMLLIDEWDDDEDMIELGGDLDEETIISRVRHNFITAKALPPFVSALSQCMWLREHGELLERRRRKERAWAAGGRSGERDWELLIQPPIPASCLKLTARGTPEAPRWQDPDRARSGDKGEVVDTRLLGEWSPQFNELVDLYNEHLREYQWWRGVTRGEGGGAWVREASTGRPKKQLTRPRRAGEVGEAELSELVGGADAAVSDTTRTAFVLFTNHGEAFFRSMLAHLKATSRDAFSETNAFLVDILISLLSSDAVAIDKTTLAGTARFFDEAARLAQLQRSLGEMGCIDVVVQLLSAARDVAMRTPYQRAIVPKAIELADEILRFGDTALQHAFVEHVKATRQGFGVIRDFLFALKAQLRHFSSEVKRALERDAKLVRDAKQEAKRLEAQAATFNEATTLLHLLQMLCEGHNDEIQAYLRVQSATRNINLVSEVVTFFREVTDSLPERLCFVPTYHAEATHACLANDAAVSTLLGSVAAEQLEQVRLIMWSEYTEPHEVQGLALIFGLVEQALDTLAEFVQGPCLDNQRVLARAHVLECVMPLLEFLLALQLSGQTWNGASPQRMVQLILEGLPADATLRDAASKWLRRLEASEELAATWAARGAELLTAAQRMERKLLVMLSGMLEGDADAEVVEHLLECLSPRVLVALLNMHWQMQLAARRRRTSQRARLDEKEKRDQELAFLYYSLMRVLTDDAIQAGAAVPLRKVFRRWEEGEGKQIIGSIRRIEINDDEDQIGRVYFQMPEDVMEVWRSADVVAAKDDIVLNVKRDNPEEKLKDFWLRTDDLLAVIKHQRAIRGLKSSPNRCAACLGWLLEALARSHTFWRLISIAMAFVVNALMLAYLRECDDDTDDSDDASRYVCVQSDLMNNNRDVWSGGSDDRALIWPSILMLVTTGLELLSHVIARTSLKVKNGLKNLRGARGVIFRRPWGPYQKTATTTATTPFRTRLRALMAGEEVYFRPPRIVWAAYLVASDGPTFFHVLFFVTAVLSVTSSYTFACINLFALVERVPTMMYVLQVVRQNGRQMAITIGLAAIVIYNFSVWAFSVDYLRNKFYIIDQQGSFGTADGSPHPHLGPDSGFEPPLLLFTLFNLDYGFREGPVFEYTFAQAENNTDVDYGQVIHGFVFNFLHYVVVLLVFTAIVSGIIIDSFAELRATREAIRLDIANVCFICDIDREDFEQLGLNFREHIQHEHNMWDYLFFRLYLEAKDPSDFNGLETYCWSMMQQGKITWFPIKKAIIIEGRNKEKKDIPGLYKRLGGLEARAAEQTRRMDRMRQEQDDQRAVVRDLRDDVMHMRKTTDEVRELLLSMMLRQQLAEPAASVSGSSSALGSLVEATKSAHFAPSSGIRM